MLGLERVEGKHWYDGLGKTADGSYKFTMELACSEFEHFSTYQKKTTYQLSNEDSTHFVTSTSLDRLIEFLKCRQSFKVFSYRYVFDQPDGKGSEVKPTSVSDKYIEAEEEFDFSALLNKDRSFDDDNQAIYVWDTGVMCIEACYKNSDTAHCLRFKLLTNSLDDRADVIKFIDDNTVINDADPGKGRAFVIVQQGQQIVTQSIGLSGHKFNESHYNESVVKDFKFAVDDLVSKTPSGRLVILDGPPGTGKTYMVKALMKAVPASKFVIIPPAMIQKLGDPNLISVFMRECYDHKGVPLVLVLEDADECLSKRKAMNMASISSILNLSDGIIGSMLDLRIVATTNTPVEDFDEALRRPGRISSYIKVEKLLTDRANALYRELSPTGTHRFTQETSLAEVYNISIMEKKRSLK